MCDTCGCNITDATRHLFEGNGRLARTADGGETLSIFKGLLDANDRAAAHNREHFDAQGVLVLNLMSSPGSGKTSLLEATIAALREELRIAVIEGDLETENDARRIRAQGVEAVQITTGTACHLDAHMIHQALHRMTLADLDLLFVENVGNLVCPASFDLGQHRNLTLLSVTEGDDKPAKYPVMFRAADTVVLTKCDLLPYIEEFDPARARAALHALANSAPVLELSAKTGVGLDAWLDWLRCEVRAQAERRASGTTAKPRLHPDGQWMHSQG